VSVVTWSDALHLQVQQFAVAAVEGSFSAAEQGDRFNDLALRIAQFQAQHCAALNRLFDAHGAAFDAIDELPALPADALRLVRVACHSPDLDRTVFRTSGTTQRHTGLHALRTLETYRTLSTLLGRKALLGGRSRATVVALLPSPERIPHSSLAAMCGFFMEAFDARTLPGDEGDVPVAMCPSRWLVREGKPDVSGLKLAVQVAHERAEPALILATSASLQLLLDEAQTIPLPTGSVVMQTGGSKGRGRQIDPERLTRDAAKAFQIDESQIICEYGMTELCSQMYEGNRWCAAASRGVYFAPPWLQVTAVDAISLRPVQPGEVGLARFVDLANVDSALVILTQDLIRQEGEGFRLLGRQPSSPLRGCSLLVEERGNRGA